MIYFQSTLAAWGFGKHMETQMFLQRGKRAEHCMKPQLRAGRGKGRRREQQACMEK